MDISTILGIVLGFGLIVFGIGLDKLGNFVDIASLTIVLGGTVAAVIASYPFNQLAQIPKHFKIIISGKLYQPTSAIDTLVEFAQIARKSGLLALEEKANELKDPFFKQSIMLIVDAMDADKVRAMLENELDCLADRHDAGAGIYEKASALAPSFGMIGTLVGLINMLKSMDMSGGGSSSLGEDMSVALITTFYGSVLANLIFGTIAKKLRVRNSEEFLYKQIIIEGVLSIQEGDNPKFLQEKLLSFLHEKQGGKKKGKQAEAAES